MKIGIRKIIVFCLSASLLASTGYWFILNRLSQSDSFCSNAGHMRTIANQMINYSSPLNSPSFRTTRKILSTAIRNNSTFNCYLPGIFHPLYGNIKRMMDDIGVKTAIREYRRLDRPRFFKERKGRPNRYSNYFVIETSFYGAIKNWGWYCHEAEVPCFRIILNSEPFDNRIAKTAHIQLVDYFERCAQSKVCVIWEYSSSNYAKMMKYSFNESVVLLPIMHQPLLWNVNSPYHPGHSRGFSTVSEAAPALGHSQTSSHVRIDKTIVKQQNNSRVSSREVSRPHDIWLPVHMRPIDIAFYGVLTPRRVHMKQMLITELQQRRQGLNLSGGDVTSRIIFTSGEKSLTVRRTSYGLAKICVVIHAHWNTSGGEYHRLTEMAPSGCVMLSEPITDVIGTESYKQCGGLLFANYTAIPTMVGTILRGIDENRYIWDRRQHRAKQWWEESLNKWPVDILNQFLYAQRLRINMFGTTIYQYDKM